MTQADPLPSWLPQLQDLAQSQAPAPLANPTYSLQAGHHSACCREAVEKKVGGSGLVQLACKTIPEEG